MCDRERERERERVKQYAFLCVKREGEEHERKFIPKLHRITFDFLKIILILSVVLLPLKRIINVVRGLHILKFLMFL